jgi:hypothetical protein
MKVVTSKFSVLKRKCASKKPKSTLKSKAIRKPDPEIFFCDRCNEEFKTG